MALQATGNAAAALAAARTEQEDDRALGFWLYLMSDAVIFALLFATYAVMVVRTAGGPDGHALFHLTHTAIETTLLLLSSITFGFAAIAAKAGRREGVLAWLLVTFALGVGFVGMEIAEFHAAVAQGAGPERSGFLSAYFTLVGTHGLHVTMGLVWIGILWVQVLLRGVTPQAASRLYRLSLFWHFLDIVWIGIFSVVYLPGIR
ncbi:MAG: cytochrome o ubiquinol oxidase subunit III [Proteobacteria bacterium]|nr:cytochrome o ubiquinol oxidase subunit III [Pseudomonadota bacterium]